MLKHEEATKNRPGFKALTQDDPRDPENLATPAKHGAVRGDCR